MLTPLAILRAAVAAALLAGIAAPTGAMTFLVNSPGDQGDAFVADNRCDITGNPTTTPATPYSGVCTLRAAIQQANFTPGTHRIELINGLAVQVLTPLPAITRPVVVEPLLPSVTTTVSYLLGASIEWAGVGASGDALALNGGNSGVRALIIVGFSGGAAVRISGGSGSRVESNYLGVRDTGAVFANRDGVVIDNSSDNVVGGNTARTGNLISGNTATGVLISGSASVRNVVMGNNIGADRTGQGPLGNKGVGVWIDRANDNTVGGPTAAERNLIAANGRGGVIVSSGNGNRVMGNDIGIAPGVAANLGNAVAGVFIQHGQGNQVGGPAPGIAICAPGSATTGTTTTTSSSGWSTTTSSPSTGTVVGRAQHPNNGRAPGNLISMNDGPGVVISGDTSLGNRVEGNTIGMDESGLVIKGNTGHGVAITDARENYVGNFAAGSGNLISGNGADGISITGEKAANNYVRGNWIGVDCTGRAAAPNQRIGVRVNGAPGTTIGGVLDSVRNLISGNGASGRFSGVHIGGATARFNRVEGNIIGMDRDGLRPIANSGDGVSIDDAPENFTGGLNDIAQNFMPRNLISGNTYGGVVIRGVGARGNRVRGNYIGTDASGSLPFGSPPPAPVQGLGVWINGAPGNFVGDMDEKGRNVISGNRAQGVLVSGSAATGNFIWSNHIGVDEAGMDPHPNGESGVALLDAADNFVGGRTPTPGKPPGNVISANLGTLLTAGVHITGVTATGNQVRGNLVGVGADGVKAMGNGHDGVFVGGSARNNLIGGEQRQHGNVIAHNGRAGVAIARSTTIHSTGNAILSNPIFANRFLGIDLGLDGPTRLAPRLKAGYMGPFGPGPNNWQRTARVHLNATTGTLALIDAEPNTKYRVQYFANRTGHTSGYGQGEAIVTVNGKTFEEVTTDAEGFVKRRVPAMPAGQLASITVTSPGNDTSEFSQLACIAAPQDPSLSASVNWNVPMATAASAPASLPGKAIHAVRYQPSGTLGFQLRMAKANPSPDEDLSKAFVRLIARNLIAGAPVAESEVLYIGGPQPLDANGQATLAVGVEDILKSLGAPLNRHFVELRAEFCYRGRLASAATPDVAHLLRDKVIAFLPGVLGSTIEVDAGSGREWAFPKLWFSPGPGAELLEMLDHHGTPRYPARHLKMFTKFTVEPPVVPFLSFTLATVYDVDAALARARALEGMPDLTFAGGRYTYYHVFPWAYDWRLKLEEHVNALLAGASPPVFDDYASPPSLSQIVSTWVPGTLTMEAPFVDRRVALAGHSTGGLIIRSALTGPQAQQVEQLVDRAYFINVPFFGAPKAYYSYLTGDMLDAFIPRDTLRRFAPDMPIVYYLAPATGYRDYFNSNLAARGVDLAGNPVAGRRVTPLKASTYMNPLIARYGGNAWNTTLADAADDFHQLMMSRDPVIGWQNTKTFWTYTAGSSNTPGPMNVTGTGSASLDMTRGDGTVPTNSQWGRVPRNVQIDHRHPTQPEHQYAANNPTVWANIIRDLNVPHKVDFSNHVPVNDAPNGATANTCQGPNAAERWGERQMARVASKEGYKDVPHVAGPRIRQGFDQVYCDGIVVKELRGTGFLCHGTLVIGEAKGGYGGARLRDVLAYGYAFQQGTIQWAGNSADFATRRGHAEDRLRAAYFLDGIKVAAPTRMEVFHAECPATGAPVPRTRHYRTDSYP